MVPYHDVVWCGIIATTLYSKVLAMSTFVNGVKWNV